MSPATKSIGNVPSHCKEPQVRALKLILVTRCLKVKTADPEVYGDEAMVLVPWVSPENIWGPDLWMCVLFLA